MPLLLTCSALGFFLLFYALLHAQTHSEPKINQQNKNKLRINKKGNNYLRIQSSKKIKFTYSTLVYINIEVLAFLFFLFLF